MTNDDLDGELFGFRDELARAGIDRSTVAAALRERRAADEALRRIVSAPPTGAQAVATGATAEESAQVVPLRRSKRGRWAFAAAATAVAASIAILIGSNVTSGVPAPAAFASPPILTFEDTAAGELPSEGASATRPLEALAKSAGDQPELADLPVQHVRSVGWSAWNGLATDGAHPVLRTSVMDSLLAPDGELRVVTQPGETMNADGTFSHRWGPWRDGEVSTDTTLVAPLPDPEYPDSLPSAPAALKVALLGSADACPGYTGGCLLAQGKLLNDSYAPSPRVRAAVWRMLATEPSITYLGPTTDRLGRDAVAFTALESGGARQLVTFADPETGAWLSTETIVVADESGARLAEPMVAEFTGVVVSERVGGTPEAFDVTQPR